MMVGDFNIPLLPSRQTINRNSGAIKHHKSKGPTDIKNYSQILKDILSSL